MFRIIYIFFVSVLFHQFLQDTCPDTVITNLHQQNCTNQSTSDISYYLNKTDCIPKCLPYSNENQTSSCHVNRNICLPGYQCEKRCGLDEPLGQYSCNSDDDCINIPHSNCLDFCVLSTISAGVHCMAYHLNTPEFADNYFTAEKFKPECDDNGEWVAKQCKGGVNGRCMCYSATGVRLFGEALYSNAENMTCACSRRRNDLESSGRTMVTLHCDSMGNYEPLQCDTEKNICWCAESKTGKLTSPVVPEVAKIKLPCYNTSSVGSQYLRQCESKKFAQSQITTKLKTHGAKYIRTDSLLCDADGSYGAYSISSGMAYCVWRDNSKIENWYSNVDSDIGNLNCNCARDYKRYSHSMTCSSNGNYQSLQQYMDEEGNSLYYCVDNDGFAKSGIVTNSSSLNCSNIY
ncbi:uncharacterized protein LOC143201566 isoform X2 [Rhynchophorus ferrugineus]|uniref:uncharacterized protein LOC143201566 isoform X2 n=1 Tax=Rhynchophorus ferrugineus TaxID=354439 RepID=UPI003FCEB158